MSERFYINSPLGPGLVTLEGPEAHHLIRVSRIRPGAAVCLFNGDGREYQARVCEVGKRTAELEIEAVGVPERELPSALEVAAPLPKGDRTQFLVEKLTELGVTDFVPLETERSAIHPGEGKLEKLQRYVIEASKQCGRNRLMRIATPTPWPQYVQPRPGPERRWVADRGGQPLPRDLSPPAPVRIAVGPEGGLTAAELALAREHGWQPVRLGGRTLRIETAALTLAAWVGELLDV